MGMRKQHVWQWGKSYVCCLLAPGELAMNEELDKVMDDVDRSAAECCAEMREKAAELCQSVEEYVRREPMKSAVIAAGFGLVTGLLLSRR
jgi:ElaB/YqjD/DUF883 family membrane-anchored ribosome-binding protein